jgi:hypothetical protein
VIVERGFKLKIVMLVLGVAVHGVAAAQPAQPAYTASVSKDGGTFVTLKAKDAKLADVAADLARRLGARVIVGTSLKDATITTELAGTPIEPAMLALAPRVFVDYEVRKDAQPVALGIYLLGLEDPDPAVTAVVQGTSQGLFISGNTEDANPPKDSPLQIKYDKGRLSVIAKQQPLIAVVLAIAEEMGVPAEVKYETRQVINADIKETAMIEDALVSLSEDVRVYVRSNAGLLEKRLLRVVIVGPAAK